MAAGDTGRWSAEEPVEGGGLQWTARPIEFAIESKTTTFSFTEVMDWTGFNAGEICQETLRSFEDSVIQNRPGIFRKGKVIVEMMKDLTQLFENKGSYAIYVSTENKGVGGVLMIGQLPDSEAFLRVPSYLLRHPLRCPDLVRQENQFKLRMLADWVSYDGMLTEALRPNYLSDNGMRDVVAMAHMTTNKTAFKLLEALMRGSQNRLGMFVLEKGEFPRGVLFRSDEARTVRDRLTGEALIAMGRIIIRDPTAVRTFPNTSKKTMALLFLRAGLRVCGGLFDYVASVRFDIIWHENWNYLFAFMSDVLLPYIHDGIGRGQESRLNAMLFEMGLFNGRVRVSQPYSTIRCPVCAVSALEKYSCKYCLLGSQDMYGAQPLVEWTGIAFCSANCVDEGKKAHEDSFGHVKKCCLCGKKSGKRCSACPESLHIFYCSKECLKETLPHDTHNGPTQAGIRLLANLMILQVAGHAAHAIGPERV